MERADCGLCGNTKAVGELVRGTSAFICHSCVADAVARSIASRKAGPGHELPEADAACSFCGKKAPASSLVRGENRDAAICSSCLGRCYALIAEVGGLQRRQYTFRNLEERSVAPLVRAHFQAVGQDGIVTACRTFPAYMRVDLTKALETLLRRSEIRCVGLHNQYGHETLQYAMLLQGDERVSLAPLQFDEIDIGEDAPARCLRTALWLVPGAVPHVVLLSRAMNYGQPGGCQLEIAVPPGNEGDAVVASYFKALEDALHRCASYRGKVLSLDRERQMMGIGSTVMVHRLAPVAREEVILPASTLALLERNVFEFARHRAALREMGLPVKKGLLFYGPPGTGKTHTIRYLAGALPGQTTLLVTAEQVASIAEYMTLARLLSPSIVVIEDADLIARQRDTMGSALEEVLLNRLLNEMDGLRDNTEILFVLTTNRPDTLEAALTARPGRIDQAIEFPLPDADGRRKLARLYGKGAVVPEGTLEHVVERTARTSAAFIKELMRRSAQFALQRGGSPEIALPDVDAAFDELLFSGGRLNAALLGALGGRPEGAPG